MAPPFAPVHVFYYEFMYKDDLPGPCVTERQRAVRARPPAACGRRSSTRRAPPSRTSSRSPHRRRRRPGRAAVFYPAVDWRPWRDGSARDRPAAR